MKIAIVHDFLTKLGGAEKVLKVISDIYSDAPIYTLLYDEKGTNNIFSDKKVIASSLNKSRIPKQFLLSKYPKAIEEFNFSEYDIVISSSNSFAHGIITKPSTFHITYCHSPMRFVWDWHNEYLKEKKIERGITGLVVKNILHKIRIWDKVASERSDAWIANSENVANRINKYYRKKSDIIYPPVDIENIELSDNIPDDYYIIVSRLEPYKKIDIAIEAFNENGKTLIVIGTGSQEEYLKRIAKNNIEFLGWQSDQSVREYLKNAKAFVFPGEEDFGITPVESMASGRPVIAYKKGGVLESIIEDETGIFFNHPQKEDLILAVEKLEKNYSKFIPKNCRKQAEKFSQQKFINQLSKIIQVKHDAYRSKNS